MGVYGFNLNTHGWYPFMGSAEHDFCTQLTTCQCIIEKKSIKETQEQGFLIFCVSVCMPFDLVAHAVAHTTHESEEKQRVGSF